MIHPKQQPALRCPISRTQREQGYCAPVVGFWGSLNNESVMLTSDNTITANVGLDEGDKGN